MLSSLRRFLRDSRANVAIAFGMTGIPMAVAMGAAMDYSRAASGRQALQAALDAGILMAVKDGKRTVPDITATVMTSLNVHLTGKPGFAQGWRVSSGTATAQKVDICVEADVQMVMLGIVNMNSWQIGACAEAVRDVMNLEVALVLDVTGSMATNNRIGALRDAASELVNTLLPSPDPEKSVKIALVPFVTAVNIRNSAFRWNWIDQNAEARYHGVNFDLINGRRVSHLDLFSRMNVQWRGCVEARAEPYDMLDTPPNPAVPDTLFVPWFWPDEPDPGPSYPQGTDYQNNYLQDRVSGTDAAARQRSTAKYGQGTPNVDEVAPATMGPNKSCPNPILPLTDNQPRLLQEIGALQPWNESGTNIAQGLMWGWHVLSPGEPFSEGRPYEDNTTQKAMVLLTDGENQIWGGWNSHNRSNYSSYGYLSQNRLGTTNDRNAAAETVNQKIEQLCARVKAQGIRLYTITFELNSSRVQEVFRNCATEPHLYFNSPSTAQLRSIFQAIASDLSRLRLSR